MKNLKVLKENKSMDNFKNAEILQIKQNMIKGGGDGTEVIIEDEIYV